MRHLVLAIPAALGLLAAALPVAPGAQAKNFTWAFNADVLTLDPHSSNNTFTNTFMGNVYEALVRQAQVLNGERVKLEFFLQAVERRGVRVFDVQPENPAVNANFAVNRVELGVRIQAVERLGHSRSLRSVRAGIRAAVKWASRPEPRSGSSRDSRNPFATPTIAVHQRFLLICVWVVRVKSHRAR